MAVKESISVSFEMPLSLLCLGTVVMRAFHGDFVIPTIELATGFIQQVSVLETGVGRSQ